MFCNFLLKLHGFHTVSFHLFSVILILCLGVGAWAAVGGSMSGTVKDTTGGVIPGAMVTVTNASLGTQFKTTTDARGYFSFPSLPVGRYDLTIDFPGFSSEKKPGLMVDTDSALDESSTLSIATETQEVEVSTSAEIAQVQVETISTQLGDVVTGNQIASVALNGRSFTDLLALQPGIVPMTTQQPDSIVMAGVTVAIAPSGALNPGNQSISGQREDANGFMVNGGDVKELMNGGTSVVPDLDSIRRVPDTDEQLRCGVRQLQWRCRQRRHQVRIQPASRQRLRVSAQHGSRCPQLLFAGTQLLPAKPVRRHPRRTDREEQAVFLWRLPANRNQPGYRYRV